LQGLPKYIKIGIFGSKKYHPATLLESPTTEMRQTIKLRSQNEIFHLGKNILALLQKIKGLLHRETQGDQIGRFFDVWAIVYTGQFFRKLQK
jgi:hypothetical protein